MRINRWSGIPAVVFAFAGLCVLGAQQDEGASQQNSPELQNMMEKATPGKHHKHLGRMVGSWNFTGKFWNTPGQDPATSSGKMEARWILGKRFVETSTNGDFMGLPFEGKSLEGHDNFTDQYTSIWADNFGTYMVQFEGTCQDEGTVRTMLAETINPLTGQEVRQKSVITVIDENSFKYEMYTLNDDGGEFKMMELVYKRL